MKVDARRGAAARGRRLLWTSTTYFGEGLPWSFLIRWRGVSDGDRRLGRRFRLPPALHLAGTLKFLWSPVVDLFGRKRTWLWVMQGVLGVGMLGVAVVAPTGSTLRSFWFALGVIAVMHATHDIACDGFYLQALDQKEQAPFAGNRGWGAFRAATMVGSSGLFVLAGRDPLAASASGRPAGSCWSSRPSNRADHAAPR